MSVRVKFDPPKKIRSRLQLEKGQKKQFIVDSECLRLMAPFVPHETGKLIESGIRFTVLGSGLVVYKTDYVELMFYGNYNFHEAPTRGNRWDLKLINTGGVKKVIKKLERM